MKSRRAELWWNGRLADDNTLFGKVWLNNGFVFYPDLRFKLVFPFMFDGGHVSLIRMVPSL